VLVQSLTAEHLGPLWKASWDASDDLFARRMDGFPQGRDWQFGNSLGRHGKRSATVIVEAAFRKRRRKDVQVMHPRLVERLKEWLKHKGEIEPKEILFPISNKTCGKYRKTHVMLRKDIVVARKAWLNESKDDDELARRETSDFLLYQDHDSRFADFHALRHTFITSLAKANVSPKTAQMLARHSDIRLTLDVYTHVDRGEQAEAIGKLKGV
jgi:integrase